MSKVKELLERERGFKNWTLDELWELQMKASDETWERAKERELSRFLNIANSYEQFEVMCVAVSNRMTKEEMMSVWLDFIEGKDNSK